MAADGLIPEEIERLRRSRDLYRGLVEVSALINNLPDLDALLAEILEVARRVLGAEASSLFLTRDGGALELVLARGPDGSINKIGIIVPCGHGIAGWVREQGRALLVEDAYADPRFYKEADRQTGFKTRSIICVPLRNGDRDLGVLQALNPAGRAAFDPVDLEAFEAYGVLVAAAIERLQALQRERERERVDRELALAHDIQTGFLPAELPDVPGLSAAASYRPARNIGGDFYDLQWAGPDEIYFTIGDVSGKGIPAALLMAQSLSAFRFVAQAGMTAGEVLSAWNETLAGRTIRGMFVTALVGRLTLATDRIEFASAGHCRPIGISPAGHAIEFETAGAVPLGVLADARYLSREHPFPPGSWLAMFTDGLTESFDPAGRPLDVAGVMGLLARPFANPEAVVDALRAGEERHRGEADASDDLTLLVLGRQ